MTNKKRLYLLDVLRVFAILLVFNSHSDALYPIPALATGGALGNALFFIISGYLLKIRSAFLPHIGKRIARLYPGVFIVVTTYIIIGNLKLNGFGDFVSYYIWPTNFWFFGAIILFDILTFCLEKLQFRNHFIWFSFIMAVIYILAYVLIVDKSVWSVEEPGLQTAAQWFKVIYYYYIYALGFYLSQRSEKRLTPASPSPKKLLILACLFFVLSNAVKLLFVWNTSLLILQFLPQLLGIAFVYYALRAGLAYEERYLASTSERFRQFVGVLSNMSLEMYLVQFMAIGYLGVRFIFPLNIVIALAATMAMAFVLQKIDQWLSNTAIKLFSHS